MGNVNGREDESPGGGGGSPGADEDGGAPDEMGVAPPPHGDGAELLMGQSPPSSPRAAQSPLMFTPQVSLHSHLLLFSSSPVCIWDS